MTPARRRALIAGEVASLAEKQAEITKRLAELHREAAELAEDEAAAATPIQMRKGRRRGPLPPSVTELDAARARAAMR